MEVSLAVLAATSTTSIVFFPVLFLSGVSKYIFTPLALGVVLSIFASYIFAMTVVPLSARTLSTSRMKKRGSVTRRRSFFQRVVDGFNEHFQRLLERYETLANRVLVRPGFTAAVILAGVALVILLLFPFLGRAYFPRTDPGQFVIDVQHAKRHAPRSQQSIHCPRREDHSRARQALRSRHDRFQYRRLSRSFRDLHHQRLHGHGVRADQPERRSQHRKL